MLNVFCLNLIYFETWIYVVHFSSSFWNLKSWISFLSLWFDGFGTFLQSWISLDVVPTKSLQRSVEKDWRAKRIDKNENHLMDVWSLMICFQIFRPLMSLYREATPRPFPRRVWRNSMKWCVSKNLNPPTAPLHLSTAGWTWRPQHQHESHPEKIVKKAWVTL